MTDDREQEDKSLGEHIEDFFEEVRQALERLVRPEPELVPIPVRNRRRYRR